MPDLEQMEKTVRDHRIWVMLQVGPEPEPDTDEHNLWKCRCIGYRVWPCHVRKWWKLHEIKP